MASIDREELRKFRKQKFAEMEDRLKNTYPSEKDRLFLLSFL